MFRRVSKPKKETNTPKTSNNLQPEAKSSSGDVIRQKWISGQNWTSEIGRRTQLGRKSNKNLVVIQRSLNYSMYIFIVHCQTEFLGFKIEEHVTNESPKHARNTSTDHQLCDIVINFESIFALQHYQNFNKRKFSFSSS